MNVVRKLFEFLIRLVMAPFIAMLKTVAWAMNQAISFINFMLDNYPWSYIIPIVTIISVFTLSHFYPKLILELIILNDNFTNSLLNKVFVIHNYIYTFPINLLSIMDNYIYHCLNVASNPLFIEAINLFAISFIIFIICYRSLLHPIALMPLPNLAQVKPYHP